MRTKKVGTMQKIEHPFTANRLKVEFFIIVTITGYKLMDPERCRTTRIAALRSE